MDKPSKVHSLFNVEQSNVFGLRVLSVMTSCLDSYLLLQSQYKLQESLLAAQANNQGKDRLVHLNLFITLLLGSKPISMLTIQSML